MTTLTSQAADSPRQILDRAAAEGRVAGVIAMVASPDEILFSHAAGYANVADLDTIRIDSVFSIASMTKAVTSVALMQLVERGSVRLDAPVSAYLDEFEPKPVLLEIRDGEPVFSTETYTPTVRQLLSHTSGFAYSVWNDRLFAVTDFSSITPTYFLQEPLVSRPGQRWHYSTSTDWVGLIVERVSGRTLEDYFAAEIFAPLGMNDTAYNIDSGQQARLAQVYRRAADGSLQENPRPDFAPSTFFSGGAGLYSTAGDYLRFMQMILNEGQAGDTRILSASSVQEMVTDQIGDLNVDAMHTTMPGFSNDFRFLPGTELGFGLGFLINEEDVAGRRRRGSLAWAGLNNTYFWIDRESQLCGVLLTQTLPFYDAGVVSLLDEFEAAVYTAFGGQGR